MTNTDFLKAVSLSFKEFLKKGTSRSTDKLKPLHGAIAEDLAQMFGADYEVASQGYNQDKEANISGRYFSKRVDITIKKNNKAIAGVGVKFVMQNYSQNSNNYFENMLGETANIRSACYPYFQIFIVLDRMPYYDKDGSIKRWETFTVHDSEKYKRLSDDNTDVFFHTPNKTLIFVIHIDVEEEEITKRQEYLSYYCEHFTTFRASEDKYEGFGGAVIINDYQTFIQKVYHTIKAL